MHRPLIDTYRRRMLAVVGAALLVRGGSNATAETGEETFTLCIEANAEATCTPALEARDALQSQATCDLGPIGDGAYVDEATGCCYEVVCADAAGDFGEPLDCGCYGRPYWKGDRLVEADVTESEAWSIPLPAPEMATLDPEQRRALQRFWTKNTVSEHSSVAGFHRFALDLLALGAPPELVLAAGKAAQEEVRHTQLCASLASAYAGEAVGPGRLPIGAEAAVARDLVELAVWTARDGAVGETLAALLASAMRDRATDPAVRRVLTIIARDESEHAVLAWKTLRWAIEVGGVEVARAVEPILLGSRVPSVEALDSSHELVAHGLLPSDEITALLTEGLEAVVRGPARMLLARCDRQAIQMTTPSPRAAAST